MVLRSLTLLCRPLESYTRWASVVDPHVCSAAIMDSMHPLHGHSLPSIVVSSIDVRPLSAEYFREPMPSILQRTARAVHAHVECKQLADVDKQRAMWCIGIGIIRSIGEPLGADLKRPVIFTRLIMGYPTTCTFDIQLAVVSAFASWRIVHIESGKSRKYSIDLSNR